MRPNTPTILCSVACSGRVAPVRFAYSKRTTRWPRGVGGCSTLSTDWLARRQGICKICKNCSKSKDDETPQPRFDSIGLMRLLVAVSRRAPDRVQNTVCEKFVQK